MITLFKKAHNNIILFQEKYLLNYVFIHINKTGGSSIEKALGLRFDLKTATEKISELGSTYWYKFSFTIVRNPWDRVVSHYHYRVETNQTNLGTNPIGFNDWVKLAYKNNVPEYYDKPKMFMPQLNWVIDTKGKILVDFIGRFEQLHRDFNYVCKKLQIKTTLPHLNKTERTHYREYYNYQSIEIVKAWFKKDIELFNYKF